MPEVQEVFRAATQKVHPEPGALERQFHDQRRRATRRKAAVFVLVVVLALGTAGFALLATSGEGRSRPGRARARGPCPPPYPRSRSRTSASHFSADGSRILSGGDVYDAETGRSLGAVPMEPIAFSPDGASFAAITKDGTGMVVVDVTTGEERWRFDRTCCLAVFSPDGRYLAAPSRAPRLAVFDLATGEVVNRFDT